MRSNTRKAFLAALVCAASINGLPIPQYGPQGMGGYGYPMNGPMMGGGNGPMMGGGNGPMMGGGGQYGMGNQYGPMNMGNNYGDGQYRNGRMRGQRYHAHASPDMWPIPKNPYKAARWNRGNGNMGFYDSGGSNDSDEDLHAPGHNRIPREDDDDDDDSASNGDTKAAGVNRMAGDAGAGASGSGSSASLASNENAAMTDSNTSINIAAMSDKILNIGAFDGATIKSTSAAASTSKPAEATQSSSGKVAATAAATGSSRQTVTRSLSKATATQVGRNAKPTPERAHSVVRIPSDKHEGAGESKHASSTAHAHQASHSKAPAATATRREPSMKRIRGL